MNQTHREYEGRVALVTGGGTGIGLEVARRVLDHGGRVVLNGRRHDVLAAAAKELDPTGERVHTVAGSIAEVETADRLAAEAMERFGRVDVLIANAGVFAPKPFLDHTQADYSRFVDIILGGTFFAAQAAARAMIESGHGGAIVSTGSMWAEQAVAATPSSAYSAAKAGVHALTRNMAIELAEHRIRVNAVAPAVVETPVYSTFIPEDEVDGVLASFDAFHPLGRNGQPKDVAELILFLASDRAAWMTGAVVPIDGGVLAGRL